MYITFHGAWIHSIWFHGVEELVLNVWKHGQINVASKKELTRASDQTSSRNSKSRLYHTKWICWSSKLWSDVLTCMYIQKKSICVNVYICVHICISVQICAYKYNIGMNMYTCVYMYIHFRQSKYMYIMIHTYVCIYTCGFSVCVWVRERICVASRYAHNLVYWPKTIMKKLWKYDRWISVIKKSVGVIGLISRDMDRFVLCIGSHEW